MPRTWRVPMLVRPTVAHLRTIAVELCPPLPRSRAPRRRSRSRSPARARVASRLDLLRALHRTPRGIPAPPRRRRGFQLIADWLILGLQSPGPQPSAAWYTAMMALLRPRPLQRRAQQRIIAGSLVTSHFHQSHFAAVCPRQLRGTLGPVWKDLTGSPSLTADPLVKEEYPPLFSTLFAPSSNLSSSASRAYLNQSDNTVVE